MACSVLFIRDGLVSGNDQALRWLWVLLQSMPSAQVCLECGYRHKAGVPVRIYGNDDWDHATHRTCTHCRQGPTVDTIVNFGELLPQSQFMKAYTSSHKADLMLVFGSSLTVPPSNEFPNNCLKTGGRLIICNMMRTRYQQHSNTLTVCARTDRFMELVMGYLEIPVPD